MDREFKVFIFADTKALGKGQKILEIPGKTSDLPCRIEKYDQQTAGAVENVGNIQPFIPITGISRKEKITTWTAPSSIG